MRFTFFAKLYRIFAVSSPLTQRWLDSSQNHTQFLPLRTRGLRLFFCLYLQFNCLIDFALKWCNRLPFFLGKAIDR
jgi:hypothetical protein